MNLRKLMTTLATLMTVLVVVFIGCKKDDYQKIDSLCPQVLFTDPAAGATGVPLNQIITVTFNEEMDPRTFTNESFIVSGSVVAGTVAFSGRTASFTPELPLIKNHTYSGRVTTAVKDLMGNALQYDYIWTFSTGDIVSPMVVKTDPFHQETGVVLNKSVTATFSELMNSSTIDDSSFSIKQGATRIAGTVSYSDSVAYFTPSIPFNSNTVYTATINTKVKNEKGIAMESDYVWTFTTLSVTPPLVISTVPDDIETGVALNKTLSATFNIPMDLSTLDTATFKLKQGANNILGTVWNIGSTTYFSPSVNLTPGTVYAATITTRAKSKDGIAMAANYDWTFTTGITIAPKVISTDPVDAETNVLANKIITATFSEAMNASTIDGASFSLKQGSTSIAGAVTYSGTKASFNPTNNLLAGITYTATINTGAKNLLGTPLAGPYTWSFKIAVPLNPFVTATDPINFATGIALNKVVSATFNENMDPNTLTSATFTLFQGTNSISGVISSNGKNTAFTPSANLLSGTMYTATIKTGAKNTSGVPIANDYTWTFTTGTIIAPKVISTNPINKASNVPLNKVLSAEFSEKMDALTISTSTFILKHGTVSITGTVSYAGTTANFKPNSNLISGETYTATITIGAKNVNGVALANNYVWTFSTVAPLGPNGPDLKSVGRFGIIAGVGVSNNAGFSKINNLDVGIYPGARSSITGFPPAIVVNGAIYASDDIAPPGVPAMLLQAKNDLTAAYLYAEGATSPAPATVSGDQGGKTLAPGIYKSTSTLLIQNGDLTLDAQGDANAVWIFQISAAFTTVGGSGGNVILSGGAQAKNVYWQVGTSATIGKYTKFKGNVMALTSITMGEYATTVGRMLARNGAVVMTSTNTIDKP